MEIDRGEDGGVKGLIGKKNESRRQSESGAV